MSFPAFLFLLPLVVVPVIIHLLSKRKIRNIEFPSLLFLVKNEIKLVRWFRLKRLLLLLIRISFVILVVLAAAGFRIPFVFPDPSVSLLIDSSPSMESSGVLYNSSFIVPTRSGVPQFYQYFKKRPSGILITDAQRNGFLEILRKGEKFPGIRVKKKEFPHGNLGIIGASAGPGFEGEKFDLNFKVLNEYKDIKKTTLMLESDKKIIEENNIILEVGENVLNFSLSFPEGLHPLKLELKDEEGFEFDNKFYFVVKVQEKKDVCIFSKNYPGRLLAALPPSFFNVEWVKKIEDVSGDFFLACEVDEEEELFLLRSSIPGIFCLQGEKNTSVSNKVPDRISTVVEKSFPGDLFYLENLSEVPLKYSCLIAEGDPLVLFENGDPFISKINNHLILPVSLEENDLSLHPVFIPFLFSMIGSLTRDKTYGNILQNELVMIKSTSNPSVISPKGQNYEPYLVNDKNYIFRETEERGFYKIKEGKRNKGLIAVNTHPSESQLESLSPEEMRYIFGKMGFGNGSCFFLVVGLLFLVLSFFIERKF